MFFALFEKQPTRISDNRSIEAWREQGFHSVLPEPGSDPELSILYQSLELGRRSNLGLDVPIMRRMALAQVKAAAVCPIGENQFANVSKKYPLGGMPWALPVIDAEHRLLENWVTLGAQGPSPAAQLILSQPQRTAMSEGDPAAIIERWESFLDAPDPKSQLIARYLSPADGHLCRR